MTESETIEIDIDEVQDEIDRLESKMEAYNQDTRGWDIWYGARNALELILDDDMDRRDFQTDD